VRVRVDLRELVDEVSRLLTAPATLEEADFTLLAFCAHSVGPTGIPDGGMDAVRSRSIPRSSCIARAAWRERPPRSPCTASLKAARLRR
jgi:hypothetical protein